MAMPVRTRSKCDSRQGERRRASWRCAGPRAGARPSRRTASTSRKTRELRGDRGVARLVGAGEVRPEPGDHGQSRRPRPRSAAPTSSRPVGGLAAAAAEPGVGLELDPGGAGRLARGGRDDLAAGPTCRSRTRRYPPRRPPARARRASTASTAAGGRITGGAQRERLLRGGGAEPGRHPPRRAARAHGHHAVPVRVRLDHGHQPGPRARGRAGRARWRAEPPDRSRRALARGRAHSHRCLSHRRPVSQSGHGRPRPRPLAPPGTDPLTAGPVRPGRRAHGRP